MAGCLGVEFDIGYGNFVQINAIKEIKENLTTPLNQKPASN